MRRLIAPALLFSNAALACPVCGQVRAAATGAMLVMTLILSLLPLVMIFGVTFWVIRGMRKATTYSKPAPVTPAPTFSPVLPDGEQPLPL
jgi:hypothetical protein